MAVQGSTKQLVNRALGLAVIAFAFTAPGSATATATEDYAGEVLANAPAGFWRLDEVSGDEADDAAGSSNGAFKNGVTLARPSAVDTSEASSVSLDGADDQIGLGSAATLDGDEFTVETWVRTPYGEGQTILSRRTAETSLDLTLAHDPAVGGWVDVEESESRQGLVRAVYTHDGDELEAYSSVPVNDNTWHHIVVRVERDRGMDVFIDGQDRTADPLPKPVLALGFEESTGSAVVDSSGNGNNGEIHGATRVESYFSFGKALEFDGIDDYVSIPDSDSLDLGGPSFAVSALIRADGRQEPGADDLVAAPGSTILAKNGLFGPALAVLGRHEAHVHPGYEDQQITATDARMARPDGSVQHALGPSLETDRWLPILVVSDGETVRWYEMSTTFHGTWGETLVNGEPVITSSAPAGPLQVTNGQLTVGGSPVLPGKYFDGAIDEVRIYDQTISLVDWQRSLARPVVDGATQLVTELSFDEGTGSVAVDGSGHGNDAALNGASWTDGRFGTGVRFDGVDDLVEVAHAESLDLSFDVGAQDYSGMTISAWVKPDQPSDSNALWGLLAKEGSQPADSPVFSVAGGRMEGTPVLSGLFADGATVMSAPGWTGRGWTHVALSVGVHGTTLYVNGHAGETWPSGQMVLGSSTGSVTLGRVRYPEYELEAFFTGVMDEVRLYRGELPPERIRSEMLTPITPVEPTTSLVAGNASGAAPFDGGIDEIAIYSDLLDTTSIAEHFTAGEREYPDGTHSDVFSPHGSSDFSVNGCTNRKLSFAPSYPSDDVQIRRATLSLASEAGDVLPTLTVWPVSANGERLSASVPLATVQSDADDASRGTADLTKALKDLPRYGHLELAFCTEDPSASIAIDGHGTDDRRASLTVGWDSAPLAARVLRAIYPPALQDDENDENELTETADAYETEDGRSIPKDPSEPITLPTRSGDLEIQTDTADADAGESGDQAGSSAVVYPNAATDIDAATRAVDVGIETFTTVRENDADHSVELELDLPGEEYLVEHEGTVAVIDPTPAPPPEIGEPAEVAAGTPQADQIRDELDIPSSVPDHDASGDAAMRDRIDDRAGQAVPSGEVPPQPEVDELPGETPLTGCGDPDNCDLQSQPSPQDSAASLLQEVEGVRDEARDEALDGFDSAQVEAAERLDAERDRIDALPLGRPQVVAEVKEIWAKDANGNHVETELAIDGNTIDVTVAPGQDVAYPVVVDPYVQIADGYWTGQWEPVWGVQQVDHWSVHAREITRFHVFSCWHPGWSCPHWGNGWYAVSPLGLFARLTNWIGVYPLYTFYWHNTPSFHWTVVGYRWVSRWVAPQHAWIAQDELDGYGGAQNPATATAASGGYELTDLDEYDFVSADGKARAHGVMRWYHGKFPKGYIHRGQFNPGSEVRAVRPVGCIWMKMRWGWPAGSISFPTPGAQIEGGSGVSGTGQHNGWFYSCRAHTQDRPDPLSLDGIYWVKFLLNSGTLEIATSQTKAQGPRSGAAHKAHYQGG